MLTDGPYAETKEQLGGYYAARVQGPRRGARLGRADPRGQDRRDRGAPGHRLRRARGAMSTAPRPPRPDQRSAERPRRPPVPARVGTGGRRPRPHPRRPRPRRGGGAGRVPDRARALARATGCPTTRRPGSSPRRATARSTGSGPSAAGPAGASRWRPSCGRSAAARTRTSDELVSPIPDDRLRLIFTTCHPALAPEARVGADAARARRADDRPRSRARSWSPSRRWRSGSCAPSARSRRAGIRYEIPRDADLPGAAAQRARDGLPGVQRRLRPAGARRAVRGGDPARPRARRADARRGRGDRPARADAPAGLAPRRRAWTPTGGWCCWPTRTARAGTRRRSPRASSSSRAAGGSAGSGRTSSRPRSPSSTRAARTGRGSSGSTTSCWRSRRRRSSRSTARSRSPSATARRPAWR